MKHYKSVEILSNFQNVKNSCANVKPPSENFLATVLVWTSHPFARRFRCVRYLPVWKSNKHANRERSSYNHLGTFYLACFARVCEIFIAWQVSHSVLLTLCFNVFMPPHICAVSNKFIHSFTYVQCGCFF